MLARLFALGLLVVPLGACVGIFADDGSSVSLGTHASGALLRGVVLPDAGAGYVVAPAWRDRHRLYATEEVVRWLTGAFARVASEVPGSVAQLGDLSSLGGGRSFEHKSHGSGRDVDIFYYAADPAGRPVRSDRAALRFGPDGEAVSWSPPSVVRGPRQAGERRRPGLRATPPVVIIKDRLPVAHFDARRTWALVRALLTDPSVEVQSIFIHRALADLMLRQGPTPADDPAVVARAAALMHQPSDAQPHDDHMHVRVYCEPTDRAFGCADRGPQRWWKKRWKYLARDAVLPPDRPDLPAAGVSSLYAASSFGSPGPDGDPAPAPVPSAPAPASVPSAPTPAVSRVADAPAPASAPR